MNNYCLGNRIYELRKEKNLSQKELGMLVGVSNKSVSKWENGSAIPKTDTLVKLSEVFGISPQELLQGKTESRVTLNQLSAQTNALFLKDEKDEIEKRDKESSKKKLLNQKRYLAMFFSLIISTLIIQVILLWLGLGGEIEEGLKWYFVLFDMLLMSYLFCGLFSGVVFAVRLVKTVPIWVLVIMCVFFQ